MGSRDLTALESLIPRPMQLIGCQELMKSKDVKKSGSLRKPISNMGKLPMANVGKLVHDILQVKWSSKFVVLSGGCLYIYKSETATKYEKATTLYGFNSVLVLSQPTRTASWAFKIVNGCEDSKCLTFSAASQQDLDSWVNSVREELFRVNIKLYPEASRSTVGRELPPLTETMKAQVRDSIARNELEFEQTQNSDDEDTGEFEPQTSYEKIDEWTSKPALEDTGVFVPQSNYEEVEQYTIRPTGRATVIAQFPDKPGSSSHAVAKNMQAEIKRRPVPTPPTDAMPTNRLPPMPTNRLLTDAMPTNRLPNNVVPNNTVPTQARKPPVPIKPPIKPKNVPPSTPKSPGLYLTRRLSTDSLSSTCSDSGDKKKGDCDYDDLQEQPSIPEDIDCIYDDIAVDELFAAESFRAAYWNGSPERAKTILMQQHQEGIYLIREGNDNDFMTLMVCISEDNKNMVRKYKINRKDKFISIDPSKPFLSFTDLLQHYTENGLPSRRTKLLRPYSHD